MKGPGAGGVERPPPSAPSSLIRCLWPLIDGKEQCIVVDLPNKHRVWGGVLSVGGCEVRSRHLHTPESCESLRIVRRTAARTGEEGKRARAEKRVNTPVVRAQQRVPH
ncbi:unnamed protein product [Pleuronectes platessa]|uniref:Uncharacterized protein n=1 Tax=Pleuronectes platessa TaxID=8262 RepID=A0A9N7YXW6_PLEPL|nr:unnamed protein product [Pleuronectes platessa]